MILFGIFYFLSKWMSIHFLLMEVITSKILFSKYQYWQKMIELLNQIIMNILLNPYKKAYKMILFFLSLRCPIIAILSHECICSFNKSFLNVFLYDWANGFFTYWFKSEVFQKLFHYENYYFITYLNNIKVTP